jgi:hypothetical protein
MREPHPQQAVCRRQSEALAARSLNDRELVSERQNVEVQRRARPDEDPKRVEQRNEDGHHDSRLSENSRNLNRSNAYGISGSHRSSGVVVTNSRNPSMLAMSRSAATDVADTWSAGLLQQLVDGPIQVLHTLSAGGKRANGIVQLVVALTMERMWLDAILAQQPARHRLVKRGFSPLLEDAQHSAPTTGITWPASICASSSSQNSSASRIQFLSDFDASRDLDVSAAEYVTESVAAAAALRRVSPRKIPPASS